MKILIKPSSLGKSTLSAIFCASILSVSMSSHAVVAQAPLNQIDSVAPNIIVTIDESTSMDRAFVPDGLGYNSDRRFRANSFNESYYNPNITYKIPPSYYQDGRQRYLSTSFEKAWYNGFKPKEKEHENLSESYTVVSGVRIRDTSTSIVSTNTLNPEYDFKCSIKASMFKENGDSDVCDGSWRPNNEVLGWSNRSGKITIKRQDTKDWRGRTVENCTAVMEYGDTTINAPCSRQWTNSDYYFVADLTNTAVPAYYYVADSDFEFPKGDKKPATDGNADCNNWEQCYRLVFVTENSGQLRADALHEGRDERQNFANWYSFYRSRSLATISAASLAFDKLEPSTRFTWQNLSDCTEINNTSDFRHNTGKRCGDNRFKTYSEQHKGEFYYWMQNMRMNNSTPLRAATGRAGEFLRKNIAWQKYLNPSDAKKNNADNTYACRASYHVLMTDGFWNGDNASGIGTGRPDSSTFTLPDGKKYTKQNPYLDDNSNSLADVAMSYWAQDLNPNLDNNVKPYIPFKSGNDGDDYWDPRNNPATWQHMTNFIVALGLSNALSDPKVPWDGGTYKGAGYEALKSGSANWPSNGTSANRVYDLWHAAINSRGEFFSAESPESMVSAFDSILMRIADRKSSAALPGTSSAKLPDEEGEGRLVSSFYQTSFDSSTGWSGEVRKVSEYRKYNVDTGGFEEKSDTIWNANNRLPTHSQRKIWIAGSTGSKLKEFKNENAGTLKSRSNHANASLADYLNINPEEGVQVATWQDRLAYIRGDQAKEGDSAELFRQRTSILGDFLNSRPAVVTSSLRYLEGFANNLEGGNDAYSQFAESIKGRKSMLYVGGNAGMLHGFNAETGVEEFAFIPTAVFPKLHKLTGKNYSHEYYVDGLPTIADVYTGSEWRTVLIGTLRAGGKGIFALDITDPEGIKLLWELNEDSSEISGDVKMGYSFPKPTVARLHNGKWAVVTGNGYKGAGTNNGAAALYLIDVMTGKLIKSLEVQSAVENRANGLSSPRLVDFDSDGIADYAYAGDLHGNLWRFDLLGNSAEAATKNPVKSGSYGTKNDGDTKIKTSYNGRPLFVATSTATGERQPITSAPSVVRHPSREGYIVTFGTGKYFEMDDKSGESNYSQTVYGVWDKKTKAEATYSTDVVANRELLVQQSLESDVIGTGRISNVEREARTLSTESISWSDKRGWFLDLTRGSFQGEMVIDDMEVLGNTLFFQTLVPEDDPCAHGSGNWLYAINPATGGKTSHHAFDTRAEGNIVVSAIKFGAGGGVSITQDEQGFKTNAPGDQELLGVANDFMGRQSWRVVPDL